MIPTYSVDDYVNCNYKGVDFTGIITSTRGGVYIVRIDNITPEIDKLRCEVFDPDGCICMSYFCIKGLVK